jgi:drug/metabolite transporter (DMT)-like permease
VLAFPTLTGQVMRYLLAVVLLVPLALLRVPELRRIPSPGDLLRLAGIAATGLVGFNICLLAALRHADAPAVGTVVGVTPLVLAVVGPLLVGARPQPRLLLAAVIVVAGIAAVEGGGHMDAVGLGYALGTLVGEVLFSLFAVPLLDRYGPLGISAWTCVLALPMFAISAVACGEAARLRAPTLGELAALGYLGLFLTAIAFLCWYSGLHRLGAATAGMFIGLVPIASLVAAVLFDGVTPEPWRIAGALLVGVGITLGLRSPAGDHIEPARGQARSDAAAVDLAVSERGEPRLAASSPARSDQ